jgi:hypothetical protein
MAEKNEKRNSETRIVKRCRYTDDMFGGEGGRQEAPSLPPGGGGYQNKCTVLNFDASSAQKKIDPRLQELRDMGLQRVWLDVAEEIGVDDFLKVWRILDSSDAGQARKGEDGRIMIPIRCYDSFLRYQRNRYIESLTKMGMKPNEIRKRLNEQLCEQISIRHISRLTHQE